MRRVIIGLGMAAVLWGARADAAAPAPPSYEGVTRVIQGIRDDWARPGATPHPNAPGWNALFDALDQALKSHADARTEDERLVALNRVYQISNALGAVSWAPAATLREATRTWLRPRVRLAWAGRRLRDQVRALPPAATAEADENRRRWLTFVDNDLGRALRDYDGANTVARRAEGLDQIVKALGSLRDRNRSVLWNPSLELEAAVNDLFYRPNLDVSADVATLAPFFNTNLVTSGPVYRKGYVSQVTAGPKTGFGLLPSDDGIAFFNSQLLSSYTPIWDFQRQVESDPQGQRAARMYQFNVASTDQQELFITAVIRSTGLDLYPSFRHNVGLLVGSAPQPGGGLMRAIASLVGYSQQRITEEVRSNALPRVQQNVVQEAYEQALENTTAQAAQRNATIRQYLIGNNRLAYQNVLIESLSLRSRPANALIGGVLQYNGASGQRGADTPQPPQLYRPDAGISADLHLTSLLANFARGYLERPDVRDLKTLLIETGPNKGEGTGPAANVKLTRDADFDTFLKAVESARAANDPKVQAIRVRKPNTPPDFGVDNRGNLVVIIRDLEIEVPAPTAQPGRPAPPGPAAKAYRISSPAAEVSLSFRVEPEQPGGALRFRGKVEGLDLGPNGKITALNEDESKGVVINRLLANVVIGLVRARAQGQALDLPLSALPIEGLAVQNVSALDPSGWIRANLVRTATTLPAVAVAERP